MIEKYIDGQIPDKKYPILISDINKTLYVVDLREIDYIETIPNTNSQSALLTKRLHTKEGETLTFRTPPTKGWWSCFEKESEANGYPRNLFFALAGVQYV